MSIGTRDELLTAIQDWMGDRTDLAPRAENFVLLTESRLNRRLRVKQMEEETTLVPSSGICTLPDDYLEYRNVTLLSSPVIGLKEISRDYADERYGDGATGFSQFFTIVGNELELFPPSSYSVELRYYETIPAITSSNTTNWLLTRYPDIYLYGALSEASVYLRDWGSRDQYRELFETELTELEKEDRGARFARGGMMIAGMTP